MWSQWDQIILFSCYIYKLGAGVGVRANLLSPLWVRHWKSGQHLFIDCKKPKTKQKRTFLLLYIFPVAIHLNKNIALKAVTVVSLHLNQVYKKILAQHPLSCFEVIFIFTDIVQNKMANALVDTCTEKLVYMYNGHLKIDKTKVLMTNGSLMKVESIADCSPWSILQYFWPTLYNYWLMRHWIWCDIDQIIPILTEAKPRSILVFSGRYHIISNASLVNNCFII